PHGSQTSSREIAEVHDNGIAFADEASEHHAPTVIGAEEIIYPVAPIGILFRIHLVQTAFERGWICNKAPARRPCKQARSWCGWIVTRARSGPAMSWMLPT